MSKNYTRGRRCSPSVSRHVRMASWALFLPLGLTACGVTDPSSTLPLGAEPLVAPSNYLSWFGETEQCSGLSGQFDRIQFYVVPGVTSFETEIGPTFGLWSRIGGTDRIILAGAQVGEEMVVRHEMLHALIGTKGHPRALFDVQCRLTWKSWAEK